MSTEDYDACEKLFCGSWMMSKDINFESFLEASGMPEQMKAFRRQQIALTITREGNSFTEKAKVGNVDFEKQQRINEEIEVKEKKENPVFHVKTIATFNDGVWSQTFTPINKGDGKIQVMKCYIEDSELVAEFSLPDVPGISAKRIYKKN